MRLFVSFLTALLFLIALFGIGLGIDVVLYAMKAANEPGARAVSVTAALLEASVPFLIGTVALAGVAVSCAVLYTGDQR